MYKILVVDDEEKIRELIGKYAKEEWGSDFVFVTHSESSVLWHNLFLKVPWHTGEILSPFP